MKTYLGYKCTNGSLLLCAEEDAESALKLEDGTPTLIFKEVCETPDEANQKWNNFHGWGKYYPP